MRDWITHRNIVPERSSMSPDGFQIDDAHYQDHFIQIAEKFASARLRGCWENPIGLGAL